MRNTKILFIAVISALLISLILFIHRENLKSNTDIDNVDYSSDVQPEENAAEEDSSDPVLNISEDENKIITEHEENSFTELIIEDNSTDPITDDYSDLYLEDSDIPSINDAPQEEVNPSQENDDSWGPLN